MSGYGEIEKTVAGFIKQHRQQLDGAVRSCAELSWLFLTYTRKHKIECSLVYMVNTNSISLGEELEDHVAPVVNNFIVDFAFTPKGVSRVCRYRNSVPPELTHMGDKSSKYGGWGYGKFVLMSVDEGVALLESLGIPARSAE